MHLVLDKKVLKETLSLMMSSVKKQMGAITSTILFQVEGGTVVLKASDNFVYTNLELNSENGVLEVEGEGRFTIEADRLSAWISNITEDAVTFSIIEEGVLLKSGTFESPFPSKDPLTFPSKMFDASYQNVQPLFETQVIHLIEALSFVMSFVSTGTSHADPGGRLQNADLNGNSFIGTDGKLLGIYKSTRFNSNLVIGLDQIKPALSYLKKQDPEATVQVLSAENFYFFRISDRSYFGYTRPRHRLPEFKGMSTDLIEPDVFEVNKEHLKNALGALKATSDPDDLTLKVRLVKGNDTDVMYLSMKAAKGKKDASVALECNILKTSEGDIEFSTSHARVEKAIQTYTDNISIAYNGAQSYLKLREQTEDGDVKVCIMTLQLD